MVRILTNNDKTLVEPSLIVSISFRAALSDPTKGETWGTTLLIGSLLILLTPLILPVFAVNGYIVRLIQRKAAGTAGLPAFDNWGQLIIDGLKVAVIGVVYALLPLIGVFITISGSVDKLTTGPVAGGAAALDSSVGGVAIVSVLGLVFAYLGVAGVVHFAHSGNIRDGFDIGAITQLVTSVDYAVAWVAVAPLNLAYSVTGSLIIAMTDGLGVVPIVVIKFYVLVVVGNLLGQGYISVMRPQPNRPLTDTRDMSAQ